MMEAHLGFLVFSYSLGYIALWLWWYNHRYPRRVDRRQRAARLLMLIGASMFAAVLVLETCGCFLHPVVCGSDCMGGCRYPPHALIAGTGLWQ
jgi:hypothetical protein